MKNDKWVMFKQYMHNELGITKEDIQQWVEDAVQKEAKVIAEEFIQHDKLRQFIKDVASGSSFYSFGRELERDIKEIIAKHFIDQIKITPNTHD